MNSRSLKNTSLNRPTVLLTTRQEIDTSVSSRGFNAREYSRIINTCELSITLVQWVVINNTFTSNSIFHRKKGNQTEIWRQFYFSYQLENIDENSCPRYSKSECKINDMSRCNNTSKYVVLRILADAVQVLGMSQKRRVYVLTSSCLCGFHLGDQVILLKSALHAWSQETPFSG